MYVDDVIVWFLVVCEAWCTILQELSSAVYWAVQSRNWLAVHSSGGRVGCHGYCFCDWTVVIYLVMSSFILSVSVT